MKNLINKEVLARKILGVTKKASDIEIKKAFWLLAMEFHPDKNPVDKEASKKFTNIVNAYEFLIKGKTLGFTHDYFDENKIGEYLESQWGYFCWWRDNFNF